MSEPIADSTAPNRAKVELPASTAWPLVLGFGVTLLAAGLATNLAFSVVGAVLAISGVAGWVFSLLPGRGHVHQRVSDPPRRIEGSVGKVGHLRAGSPGFRFQLPLKVRPISAGIKGGIVGGVVMPIPALVYGVQSGHGIWFPINLLAAMVVPSLEDADVVQLEHFRLSGLLVGLAIHAVFSVSFGLLYGVVLPTLPDLGGLGPIFWGGVLMPLLWTGVCYGLMGIVNPILEEHVDWLWFLLSQFAYGIVMAMVVFREEQIPVPPAGASHRAALSLCHFVILSSLLTSGCELPGKPNPADAYRRPDDVTDFSQLYRQNCAGCHGAHGALGPAPPLHDELFIALVSDAELLKAISEGRRGTSMPAFLEEKGGTLTAEQVRILAHGIKSHWGAFHAPADAPPLHVGGEGNIAAGAAVFERACAACHGNNGEGATAGPIHDQALLQLMSDKALRRYVITGRPDLGMPNFQERTGRGDDFTPLTNQEVHNLTAYLGSWRKP